MGLGGAVRDIMTDSAESPTEGLGIGALHHVGISTLDLDRLVAFYRNVFGFEILTRSEWPIGFRDADEALALTNSAASMVMLRLGDVHLELFEFVEPRPAPVDAKRPITGVGINHICLVVDDLAAAHAQLEAAGVWFHSSPKNIGDGPFAYCRDPDGNAIELWQLPTEESP